MHFLTRMNEDQRLPSESRLYQNLRLPIMSQKGDSFRMPQGDDLRKAVILAEVLGTSPGKEAFSQDKSV